MTTVTSLIDVHTHHYPEAYLDACRRPDSGFTHYLRDDGRIVVLQNGAVALAAPQPLPGIDARLSAMDSAGVKLQVLSISAPNVYALPRSLRVAVTRDCNDELETMAAAGDGRLQVFASVPHPEVDDALAEADRALSLPHTVGLILGGFNRSSQHLDAGGGSDGGWAAAAGGSFVSRSDAVPWAADGRLA